MIRILIGIIWAVSGGLTEPEWYEHMVDTKENPGFACEERVIAPIAEQARQKLSLAAKGRDGVSLFSMKVLCYDLRKDEEIEIPPIEGLVG